ncbi:MAG: hypothetical protein HPY64_16555 [Anaerolineae bacterium]|nr:hypothetical protein [Anaerolineae bacterium]
MPHPQPASLTAHPHADLAALLLITLAVLIFFAPVWAGGGWLPYGGGDLVSFLWPTYRFAARLLPGALPLWNPHQYSGAPFWADNQSGVLYPPNLLFSLLLDDLPYQALEALVMAHIWLAGIAMYACLRLIRRDAPLLPAPAAAGAIAFMLSDVFVTHQGNLNLIAVAAWLPLIFLGVWRGLEAARFEPAQSAPGRVHLSRAAAALADRWIILAGVTFGLGTLAGHAQMTYFTALLVGLAGLWRLGEAVIGRRRAQVARMAGKLLMIGLIALGLSAAALLPALELTGYTTRAGLSYEQAARYSLPPQALIGLVAPWVYGRGPRDFSGSWDRVEVGYIGALALTLAVIGAAHGLRRRDGLAVFLALAAALSFLLALGGYFPLHRLAYAILPGFGSLRAPARFVLLADFAAAGLAALALQTLTARGSALWRRSAGWIVAALVAAELIAFGAGIEVQAEDPRTGYDHADAVAWLQAAPDAPFRIEGAAPGWQPDSASLYGGQLYDITGVSNPLALAAYDAYYWGVGRRGSPTYNFLGAKYVIAASGAAPPGDATFVPVYEAASGVTIYLNTGAQPLARLVYRATPVETPEAAWEAIHAPAWDANAVVYVEGGPALDGDTPPGGSLFFTVYEPSALAVVVNTPAPAYLVLAETWYPGWQAFIDGQSVPIYRANTAFRAVYIDTPGEHTVLLAFRPAPVAIGLAISGATILVLLSAAANAARRRSSL